MKNLILAGFFLIMAHHSFAQTELRCGWYSNSPGETDLQDKDGSWSIRRQGGPEAKIKGRTLMDPLNRDPQYFQPLSGSIYRACACVKGTFDKKLKRALLIETVNQKKITDCEKKVKPIFPTTLVGVGHTIVTEPDEIKLQVSLSQSELHIEEKGFYVLSLVREEKGGYLCKTDSSQADEQFVFIKPEKDKLTIVFRQKETSPDADVYEAKFL